MRISDWSSDVCSSDLTRTDPIGLVVGLAHRYLARCTGEWTDAIELIVRDDAGDTDRQLFGDDRNVQRTVEIVAVDIVDRKARVATEVIKIRPLEDDGDRTGRRGDRKRTSLNSSK